MAPKSRFRLPQIPCSSVESVEINLTFCQNKEGHKSRLASNPLVATSERQLQQDGGSFSRGLRCSQLLSVEASCSAKSIDSTRFLCVSHRMLFPMHRWAENGYLLCQC